MDANARAKYHALHAQDKVRHAREMKAYTPPVVVPGGDGHDFDADDSPTGMESATHYGQAGPSMTTIRKECRHVLNDTIDLLLALDNMMDVLETGKKFKPDSSQIKVNQQVAFQRFVIAETKRRRAPDEISAASTSSSSSSSSCSPFALTDEDISDIGRRWRGMPWSYERIGGRIDVDIATQAQYGQLSPGEVLFVETCQGSRSYQVHEKRLRQDHGYLYRQWNALAP